MSGDLHLTAWGVAALQVVSETGRSLHDARDCVILEWLAHGDTRPYADWILRGHLPSPAVLRAVAIMMARGDNPDFDPVGLAPELKKIADLFPLKLTVTGTGKRTKNLENPVRDRCIALEVSKQMASGKSYNDDIDTVTDWLNQDGSDRIIACGSDAVEKAYKRHKNEF